MSVGGPGVSHGVEGIQGRGFMVPRGNMDNGMGDSALLVRAAGASGRGSRVDSVVRSTGS